MIDKWTKAAARLTCSEGLERARVTRICGVAHVSSGDGGYSVSKVFRSRHLLQMIPLRWFSARVMKSANARALALERVAQLLTPEGFEEAWYSS